MHNDDNEEALWQYKPNGGDALVGDAAAGSSAAASSSSSPRALSWQSVEFVEHSHGPLWYLALALVTAGLTLLIYFLTRDYIATGMIPIVGVIVGVFATHKPGTVKYEITGSGLKVGAKNYPYNSFKSFSILDEGSYSSVNLMPLKRFVPPIAAYFDPADQQKVINALGDYLPYEQRPIDGIERLTRRLHL